MSQNVQYLPSSEEMTVNYTGYEYNDSSIVAVDLAVGYVVTAYKAETDGTLKVCRPQTETFARPKFVVTAIPADCNSLPYTATPTRRKGGLIKVTPLKTAVGYVNAMVATGLSANATVGVTDDSFVLTTIADAAIDTAAKAGTRVGVITADTSSQAIAPVLVGGF